MTGKRPAPGFLPRLIASLFFFTVMASAITAGAVTEIPELRGRITDLADMISPETEARIEKTLADLERTDSTQIVLLTVPTLDGEAVESFSLRVAEKWKVGHKGVDNGILFLVARDDRKMRIEVGYGLEGRVTDLLAGRILDTIVRPAFRQGDFDRGISEGTQALVSAVRGEFKSQDLPAGSNDRSPGGFVTPLLIIAILVGIVGSIRRVFGGVAGAILFPLVGVFLFPLSFLLFLLIPAGFLLGLALPSILSVMGSMSGGGGFHRGGGGFSSGGFSGGGGGFGGGGASGSW